MQRLRVGYVGVAYSSYFAEEHDQYGRALRGLEELGRELDFELVAIPYGLTDMALTEQAAAELRAKKIDLLLLQTAGLAAPARAAELVEWDRHQRSPGAEDHSIAGPGAALGWTASARCSRGTR